MKPILTLLLIMAGHSIALAQNKDNIYVDIGVNERGISATYDRKLTKHFELGLGASADHYLGLSHGDIRSACYVDLRRFRVKKRNLWFGFADVGLAINGGEQPRYATMSPYGVYAALGFGYCYQVNKRGMGPYVSLGLDSYSESVYYKDPHPPADKNYSDIDALLLLSVGFKF